MTVKDLIEALADFPPEQEVAITVDGAVHHPIGEIDDVPPLVMLTSLVAVLRNEPEDEAA